MADISQIKLPDNSIYDIKDGRISNTDISNWNSSSKVVVTMSETQPSSANQGDIWFVEEPEEETLLETQG